MANLKIYGDHRSGNCLKVKWTASYLGIDFEWIEVDVLSGKTRTEEFLTINPTGQVPAVVLSDGRFLSQSNAIVLYLASLRSGALLPDDLYARAKVDEWLFWEQYTHEPAIAVRRFQRVFLGKSDEDIDPQLLVKGERALTQMEQALKHNKYLVGETMTIADIVLLAYTRVAPEGGFDLARFPAVRTWIARVEGDLSVSEVEAA